MAWRTHCVGRHSWNLTLHHLAKPLGCIVGGLEVTSYRSIPSSRFCEPSVEQSLTTGSQTSGCSRRGLQMSLASPQQLSPAHRSSEISRRPNFSQNLLILTTGRRGEYSRHIPHALSHRSRLEEPASPAPRRADVWRAPVGSGVTGWLMRVIADDAHLSRPLLSATSCAIFVNN